jgi:hypothetical protein
VKGFVAALAIVAVLGLGAFLGQGWVEKEVARNLATELVGVELVSGADGSVVDATVQVTNNSQFAGSFVSLDGTVHVSDTELEWRLGGIESGAVIAPGESRALSVEVPVDMPRLLQLGVGAVLSGGVEMRFDGTLVVGVFGVLRVPVEIHDQHRFPLR